MTAPFENPRWQSFDLPTRHATPGHTTPRHALRRLPDRARATT